MVDILKVIAGELDKFSKISHAVKLKSEIWTATALLENSMNNYDEVQSVMEAVYEIREALKELQEKELGAEERLAELRQFWNKTVMKPLWKRWKMEQKRAKREKMERRKRLLELNRDLKKENRDLKRKVRQEQIVQKYKDDPLLQTAEDECIEILKSRMNVD